LQVDLKKFVAAVKRMNLRINLMEPGAGFFFILFFYLGIIHIFALHASIKILTS